MKCLQKFALLFIFIFQISVSLAQNKNFSIANTEPSWLEKVSTSPKKPALKDIQDGYYIFLYEQQDNLETNEQYEHIIRDIVSDNGVQNASQISITYDPSYQKLTFHKVTVWRNNKAINKLTANSFKIMQNESELSRFIYSGTYDAYLILDDIRKGDRIEFSYTIKGHNPVFANKYNTTIYFQWGSQIANLYHNIIAKKERQFKIKNFNTVPTLKTIERNGLKVYQWQDELTKTIKTEDYEPSWYNPYGRVQFSEVKSWKEVVDWALKLNQYDLSKANIFNAKVKEFKNLAKDKEQYFNLVARFVQDEIRYMGIEMGEYSHRPNSPEKVLKQRYGDCKDKSLLLISLLKANGINAYSVYINTYTLDKTNEVLPAPNVFNHEVSVVEFNGKKIWIDATMTNQGGPILQNYFPYTANVLVIKPGNDKLEYVASNARGKIVTESIFKLSDTVAGSKTALTIKSIYKANCAEDLRSTIGSSGINALSKDYVEYYTKQYPGTTVAKEIEIADDRNSNEIIMTEYYEIKDIWENSDSDSDKLIAYFYSDMINNEIRPLKKARSVPFSLKYPSYIHQTIKLILPEKWSIKDEQTKIEGNSYSYTSNVKLNNDTVSLEYTYHNVNPTLAPSETAQYVKDKANIIKDLNYNITWNKNGTESGTGINTWAVIVFMIALAIGVYLSIRIYTQKSEFDIEEIRNARQINGWLILVAIGIVLTPIIQTVNFFKYGHFNNSTWVNISSYELTSAIYIRLLLFSEIIVNTLLIVYSVLIMVLFFNRRKSLPQHYIIFRVLSVVIPVIDIIMVYSVYAYAKVDLSLLGIDIPSEVLATLRSLVVSAIWIAYFLRSTRVKETFVFTYPSWAWKNQYNEINLPFPNQRLENEEQHFYEIPPKKEHEDI